MNVTIFRWHGENCPHKSKGRRHTRCDCPLWVDRAGVKPRLQSLRTRDWQEAIKAVSVSNTNDIVAKQDLTRAIEIYLADYKQRNGYESLLLARSIMKSFRAGIKYDRVDLIDTDTLEDYFSGRDVADSTKQTEMAKVRAFFKFCVRRKWCMVNPMDEVRRPRHVAPPVIVPFTEDDIQSMLSACGEAQSYCGKRARAAILLLRHTGMRIRDVTTLRRDAISPSGELRIRTHKNKKDIMIPLPPVVIETLSNLPRPRTYDARRRMVLSIDSDYFFWSGHGMPSSAKNALQKTLATVFAKAGFKTGTASEKRAHAHKFRHTFVTELLSRGATALDVADIVGMTPAMVHQRYAQWSSARQERVNALVRGTWG